MQTCLVAGVDIFHKSADEIFLYHLPILRGCLLFFLFFRSVSPIMHLNVQEPSMRMLCPCSPVKRAFG